MAYSPSTPPSDPAQLSQWLQRELSNLKQALDGPQSFLRLQVTNVAPTRFGNGDIYEADGVNWDPGSGAGTYIRRAGAWVKLG